MLLSNLFATINTIAKMELGLYLDKTKLFNEEVINNSLNFFKEKTIKRNEFFLSEGEIGNSIAYIIQGKVRAFSLDALGKENTTCFKKEKDFITSLESFDENLPSKKSYQALENTEILVISYSNFKYLTSEYSGWKHLYMQILEKEYKEKEHFLTHYKNKTAQEKYQQLLTYEPQIAHSLPLSLIASYLGITERTLSRIRKESFQNK